MTLWWGVVCAPMARISTLSPYLPPYNIPVSNIHLHEQWRDQSTENTTLGRFALLEVSQSVVLPFFCVIEMNREPRLDPSYGLIFIGLRK